MNQPQQGRSQETHSRILKAAAECIAELGYARTSTQVIAQRAGVSKGGLFARFPSKIALYKELMISLENQTRDDAYARLPADFYEQAIAERARWCVETYLKFCRSIAGRAVNEVWAALETDEALRESLKEQLRFDMHLGDLHRAFPECPNTKELQFLSQIIYAAIDMMATNERLVGNADLQLQVDYLVDRLVLDIELLIATD